MNRRGKLSAWMKRRYKHKRPRISGNGRPNRTVMTAAPSAAILAAIKLGIPQGKAAEIAREVIVDGMSEGEALRAMLNFWRKP